MPILSRRTSLLIGAETTYGTLSTSLVPFEVWDVVPRNDSETRQRLVYQSSLSKAEQATTVRLMSLTFSAEVKGFRGLNLDGPPTPAYALRTALRGCGMTSAITTTPTHRCESFRPLSNPNTDSVSIVINMDGIQYTILGAWGNATITLEAGEFPIINFEFTGLFGGITDTPFTPLTYEQEIPTICQNDAMIVRQRDKTFVIGTTNRVLRFGSSKNSQALKSINLNTGTYTGQALAEELRAKLAADVELTGATSPILWLVTFNASTGLFQIDARATNTVSFGITGSTAGALMGFNANTGPFQIINSQFPVHQYASGMYPNVQISFGNVIVQRRSVTAPHGGVKELRIANRDMTATLSTEMELEAVFPWFSEAYNDSKQQWIWEHNTGANTDGEQVRIIATCVQSRINISEVEGLRTYDVDGNMIGDTALSTTGDNELLIQLGTIPARGILPLPA